MFPCYVSTVVCFLALLQIKPLHGATVAQQTYCWPGESCYPSIGDLTRLDASLEGFLAFPGITEEYGKLVLLHNVRMTRFPSFMVIAKSTKDVQKAVLFANELNLKVSVQSSGHDYNGRCTWEGSLQINLSNMTNMNVSMASVRNSEGEIQIESGTTWMDVYKELDKHNRVIIGGSAHTVSMGGYTQGGGHSPMSRMFGMAVDNLLEAEVVTADGRIIQATETNMRITDTNGHTVTVNDADLFWALRGGGGGTFGIVTKFTFKIHQAAPSVVNFICNYPITLPNKTYIGRTILHKFSDMLPRLAREWGGYLLVSPLPLSDKDGSFGSIIFFLNHYGPWDSDTRKEMDELYTFEQGLQRDCRYINYTSFLQYENTANDPPTYRTYIYNTLVANLSDSWINGLMEQLLKFPLNASSSSATGTLIGGKMHEIHDDHTAVHPGFRHSYISLSAGLGWDGTGVRDEEFAAEGYKLNEQFRKYGYGMYRNEASPLNGTWSDDFWGTNYKRLLTIKKKWDPNNFFTCIDCVGSDHP